MESHRSRLNELSGIVLDAAIAVHREMGPGLLETVYQQCLVWELVSRGLHVETHVAVPLVYKGNVLSKEYKIDTSVEHELILELNACEIILPVHEAQIISYLRL